MKRLARAAAGSAVAALLLTGCDFDVYSLPLPGGTDVGDDPITVTVQFEDVLDLVPKSTVKVNDVSVGQVKEVSLDGYHAEVTLQLRNDTELPDNAVAEIRQTSLLGEKFVSLSAPDVGASAEPLSDGDTIPLDHSGRNPEVEEVLGALSLVLNGGGVAQLKTIAQELNNALTGREDAARSVLTQIETFTATLDDNKADVVNAIEALNRLSLSVRQQQGNIDLALDELPSALTSIDGQRQDLVRMLRGLNELGDVGVRVIKASKDATIESFRQLQPVLNQLADSGDAFVKAFHVFLTYPFVDEVVGRDPQVARNLHMGDYTNLSITLDLDFSETPNLPTELPTDLPAEIIDAVQDCLTHLANGGDPRDPVCASLVGTQVLQQYCADDAHEDELICTVVAAIPGLPPLPVGGGGQSAGGAAPPNPLPTALPSLPLPGLGSVISGLGRAGTGPWKVAEQGGPTMAQLQAVYDPALVNLLVPQLVVQDQGGDQP